MPNDPKQCKLIAQRPQRQDSLNDQLTDLHAVATRLGMYDAADFITRKIARAGSGHSPEPPAEKHAAYADPIEGGWNGYQAACWDCDWRSETVHPSDRQGKSDAQDEAAKHMRKILGEVGDE